MSGSPAGDATEATAAGTGRSPDTLGGTVDAETLTTVATIGVLGFIGFRLVGGFSQSVRGPGRRLVTEIVAGLRWRHVVPVPAVLTVVVLLASFAVTVPGLDWGWWTALGGTGNPVTGGTEQTVGTVWEWAIPAVFVVLLAPALPLFALAEERIFREGAEGWSWWRRALKCVQFGLVHALIGVPIGVALALTAGGAYFLAVYLREFRRTGSRRRATLESTRAHTAYNGVIMALVVLIVALTALGAG